MAGVLTTAGVKAGTRDVWKEDVAQIIADISPDETPLLNMIPHIPVDSIKYEWPVKKLNALQTKFTDTANVGARHRAEGSPAHDTTKVNRPARSIIDSHVMNFSQDVEVSDRLQAVNPFGVNDEFSLQAADSTKELAKEMEAWVLLDYLTADENASTGDALGTASDPTRMKTLQEQILQASGASDLNFTPNVFSANALNTKMLTVGGALNRELVRTGAAGSEQLTGLSALKALDETMILDVATQGAGNRDSGGVRFDTLMLPTANFVQAGKLANVASPSAPTGGNLHFQIDASLKRVIRVVKLYDSQIGMIAVVHNRWLPQATNTGATTTYSTRADPFTAATPNSEIGIGWMFERKFLSMGFLIPFTFERLARNGLSERGVVSGDGTVVLEHPQAAACIVGLNNVG